MSFRDALPYSVERSRTRRRVGVSAVVFLTAALVADLTGFDMHWYLWGLLSIIASFFFARQGIGFSAKVLGLSLILETLILLVFDFAVLFRHGFSFEAFAPSVVFSGSIGSGLLLAAEVMSALKE